MNIAWEKLILVEQNDATVIIGNANVQLPATVQQAIRQRQVETAITYAMHAASGV